MVKVAMTSEKLDVCRFPSSLNIPAKSPPVFRPLSEQTWKYSMKCSELQIDELHKNSRRNFINYFEFVNSTSKLISQISASISNKIKQETFENYLFHK